LSRTEFHPELEHRVAGISKATKEQRFWLARQGLWAIVHAAKHNDEATQDLDWRRRDALAVILLLGALLEQDPPE